MKLHDAGRFQEAVPPAERSLALLEKALGPTHLAVATSMNSLAELHEIQGAYRKVEPLYLRALDIFEKARGPMHPDVAAICCDSGVASPVHAGPRLSNTNV